MSALDVFGVLQAMQQLERDVSVSLMYAGLRIPQFRLLDRLDGLGSATVTELSRELSITRSTASVLTNEMIAAGILVVEDHPQDRRSFHIHMSELGRNKLTVARSDLAVLSNKLAKRYPEELIVMLNRFARSKKGRA
jgi:DNA-binding MarR family transcriptional regulator